MHNFGYAEEGQQERVGDARLWWRIVSYCSEHVGALTAAVLLSLAVTVATRPMCRVCCASAESSVNGSNEVTPGSPTTVPRRLRHPVRCVRPDAPAQHFRVARYPP